MPLVDRALRDAVLRHRDVPVLIIEGARAVGKTTLVRDQIAPTAGFAYVTMVDASTRAFAFEDTQGWLRSLPRPVVIDEAQLLPDLPLALKAVTDGERGGEQFLLTGSASIGRAGFDGADPLSRRSLRLTMHPLVGWEKNGQTGSVVDLLFHGLPRLGVRSTQAERELAAELTYGGFPGYVYPAAPLSRRTLHARIRSDVLSLVSDRLLPDVKLDAGVARGILDGLLRNPGGIFNASRFAQQLDLDRRTIDRYVAILERLFLIHRLPNLATGAHRQTLARAKVHPVDTSFSVESLSRAGTDIVGDRETWGALIESHVVNQLIAAGQWASTPVEYHYWRQASQSNPEVDLVLRDGEGRNVGVEVKASQVVRPADLGGLRAMRRSIGLHRGYVFYAGNEVRQLDESIWALPLSVLGDSEAFVMENLDLDAGPETPQRPLSLSAEGTSGFDATLFLSYVHDDDRTADGRIVQFARDLVDRYSFLFGAELQLFVDREDIIWGENWSDRLSSELSATSFLLSVVTPRYLRSEACRREVLEFAAAAKQAHDPKLLLPLLWVAIDDTDVVAVDDPVRAQLQASQYVDVSAIRRTRAGSLEYEALLEEVAKRLRASIRLREAQGIKQPSDPDSAPDLMEIQGRIESRMAEFAPAVGEFKASFDDIGAALASAPRLTGAQTYATAAALQRLGQSLEAPVARLEAATGELGRMWRDFDSDMSQAVLYLGDMPDIEVRRGLWESLDGMVRGLEVPGIEIMEQQLQLFGNISRHLRPMSRAVGGAIRLLAGIRESAVSWRDRIAAKEV